MNTVYPLKTSSRIRPLLIGFRKANGLTQEEVSEGLGITQQTYARLEVNPASANMERLFRVFIVLGVEMVLPSGPQVFSSMSSSTMDESEQQKDSPTRRERW